MGLLDRLKRGLAVDDASDAEAAGAGEAGDTSGDEAQVLAALVTFVAEQGDQQLAAAEIDPTANIFDYGYVDSLGLATFLAQIEERFGVRISDEELITHDLTTLAALAHHVARAHAGKDPEP